MHKSQKNNLFKSEKNHKIISISERASSLANLFTTIYRLYKYNNKYKTIYIF